MPVSKKDSSTSTSRSEHDLYKNGDADAPDCIKDSNGEVVLGLCRVCGRGEIELKEPCDRVLVIVDDPYKEQSLSPEAIKKVHDWYDSAVAHIATHTRPAITPLSSRIASAPRLHDNDNPLWQGPSGEGWNGGISQSMIVRFLSCRERFRLKYVLGLEPHDKWNHRLGYGNMWHTCEEAHAKGKSVSDSRPDAEDVRDVLAMHASEMCVKYPLQQEEIFKWYNVCKTQFPEYVKYWQEHPDVKNRTPLLQEQAFDVPYTLPSGRVVRLRGKWDSVDLIQEETEGLLGRHKEVREGIWLQENKTKGDVDKLQIERQLKFDLQTMVYLIALANYQHDVGFSVARGGPVAPILGVRYNVVRRPLSGGKGSISPHKEKKPKKGRYVPAETDEQFYERLRRNYLAAEPDYWFFRVRGEVGQRDIEVFRETCLDPILEQMSCWYNSDPVPPWAQHYRTPFGVYSALEEGGATEYDAFLETGSEAGLRRVTELFPELK